MPDNVTAREITIQQSEIPQHYAYIYKFRVEQCPLFLQHKCTQHRPFTCFHWHFQNQRRRKPVRRRDGTLNYSADEYCTKYDETTGILNTVFIYIYLLVRNLLYLKMCRTSCSSWLKLFSNKTLLIPRYLPRWR